ncbi:MAG: hypothetical protein ACRDFZ_08805 [Candidatus Limnocylindria bacterium]
MHSDPDPNPDGPTEMVETDSGQLVERLSATTATLLLIWLVVIGAGSALLAAWLIADVVLGERLGAGALFSDFGFYVALYGATGPTVLWLSGRAQGHTAAWFVWTAARIGLFMAVLTIGFGSLVMFGLGAGLGGGTVLLGAAVLVATLAISVLWGLATWAADRWIARARVG